MHQTTITVAKASVLLIDRGRRPSFSSCKPLHEGTSTQTRKFRFTGLLRGQCPSFSQLVTVSCFTSPHRPPSTYAMFLHRFAKTIAIVDVLAAKVNSLAPKTLTSFNNLEHARLRSEEPERGLRRRQYDDNLTTGTITVTVAPDETCGFDDQSYRYTCPPSTACSWELDSIADVFCGLEEILTACLDRIDAIDTDICDDDCYWDDYILKW